MQFMHLKEPDLMSVDRDSIWGSILVNDASMGVEKVAEALTALIARTIPCGSYRDENGRRVISVPTEDGEKVLQCLAAFAKSHSIVLHISDGAFYVTVDDTIGKNAGALKAEKNWRVSIFTSDELFRRDPPKAGSGLEAAPGFLIEFWRKEGGFWITNTRNLYARKVAVEFAEKRGFLQQAGAVFPLKQLHDKPIDSELCFPVDMVYTWVNHSDEGWRKLFEEQTGRPIQDSSHKDRFYSREELRYSLRSVSQHVPWVRTIFIVSNCAPPPWLDLEHPQIRWVDHEHIFDSSCLPTFNSHAIESRLHHIESLAEHFLYMNDDFFFMRNQRPAHYFQSNGVSCSALEPYGVVNGDWQQRSFEYLNAARNGKRLIEDKFGVAPTQLHLHAPYALKKSVLLEIEEIFPEALKLTAQAKFRDVADVSLPSFLYHHYAYQTRHAIRTDSINAKLVKFTNSDYKSRLRKLFKSVECDVLCINDGAGSSQSADWCQTVDGFLTNYFPGKCQFEI